MKTTRMIVVATLVLVLMSGLVWAGGQQEQAAEGEGNFFDKTVKIIIPYGAGGTHDVVSRRFAEVGSRYTNAPIIVENVTGGDGIVAAIQFTRKSDDVQELLCTSYGKYYQKVVRGDQIRLDLDEIRPIGVFDDRSYILYVSSNGPFQDVDDVIAESMRREVVLSAGAVGADAHLAFGGMIEAAGGESVIASYEGGAQQIAALLNGEADVFVGTSQVGMQYVENGDVLPILTFTGSDFTGFEGMVVPNVVDAGYPGSAITGGGFLSVRAGASEQTAQDVEELIRKVWADPDFRDWTEDLGLNVFELYGDELEAHIEEATENARNAAVALGLITE
jgi:tripartite-type tricarboxylate transporter receptor subunit TctC